MQRLTQILMVVAILATLMMGAVALKFEGHPVHFVDNTPTQISPVVQRYAEVSRDAYLYAFPLLNSYRDLKRAMSDPRADDYLGSFNELRVRDGRESVGEIHVDAWLDLRTEPMLVHIPAGAPIDSRIRLYNLFGQASAEIAGSQHKGSAGNYLVVSADWTGKKPMGITQVIRSDTDLLRLQGQTPGNNESPSNGAWHQQVALVPLSAYVMEVPPQRAPRLKLPRWQESAMDSLEFIPYLNYMMQFIHPGRSDVEAWRRFALIGVQPGTWSKPKRRVGAIAAGVSMAQAQLAEQQLATIRPN